MALRFSSGKAASFSERASSCCKAVLGSDAILCFLEMWAARDEDEPPAMVPKVTLVNSGGSGIAGLLEEVAEGSGTMSCD